MSSLFGPKPQPPIPVVNPADTSNRLNDALARRLSAGGVNADQAASAPGVMAPSAMLPRAPTLTGIG